jgi:ribosomal-protein-serine acetyltransferase
MPIRLPKPSRRPSGLRIRSRPHFEDLGRPKVLPAAGAVSLRPLKDTDVIDLLEAVRESIADISPWMVWCHADYSCEHAAGWIRTAQAARTAATMYEFAIHDRTERFAGCCSINHINNVDRFASVSYWIRSSMTGKGIAPSAVLALVEWAWSHTELNRLEIVAAVGNSRSQRVAQKVNAHRDCVLAQRMMVGGAPSDAVMYSLVRPTYHPPATLHPQP